MAIHMQQEKSRGSSNFPEETLKHSEELAHQLVRHLGIVAARKTCAENHWTGVLAAIDALNRA